MMKRFGLYSLLSAALILVACDPQRVSELEPGTTTEADVRTKFGEPEKIWEGENGQRVFEYNRQPNGYQNFMITLGADGKMVSIHQVLTPANFAKVLPGMPMEDVRRMLGKPMKVRKYDLKPNEIHYDWRFQDGPNKSDSKIFTVTFDADLHVVRTGSGEDPDLHAP